MKPKPRIMLCDDHALVVEGLRSLLAKEFDIVSIAANGRELVSEVARHKPDAVFVDISMPILNGMEASRQIKALSPSTKLLFITQIANREYVQAAFEMGASAYILKQSVAHEVVNATREALAGRYYITPQLCEGIPEALYNSGRNPASLFGTSLTPRQREVLQLVAEGKANKEIANSLSISLKTVDFHKARLMDQLGLRTTAELTRYAIEHGIVGT